MPSSLPVMNMHALPVNRHLLATHARRAVTVRNTPTRLRIRRFDLAPLLDLVRSLHVASGTIPNNPTLFLKQ